MLRSRRRKKKKRKELQHFVLEACVIRGPAILAEEEPAGESIKAEGAEGPEVAMEGLEVEIPGVST